MFVPDRFISLTWRQSSELIAQILICQQSQFDRIIRLQRLWCMSDAGLNETRDNIASAARHM
jgi:hypothetical protein